MRIFFKITVFFIVILIASSTLAQVQSYIHEEYRLSDTPTKFGFKGLYTLFDSETYPKGKFGVGLYWDMAHFCLPGDPRYPRMQEFSLAGAYGVTDRLEIGLSAPFRYITIPAASAGNRSSDDVALKNISENGFGNLSLGIRYKIVDWLTPYLQVFLPTASDPQKGTGAENTRIHIGFSMRTELWELWGTRLYGQAAYQFATSYDQERRNFSEVDPNYLRPRFERFGTNPLFHEYGNTLFYGAGLALPVMEYRVELFSELQFYHSFEDKDSIPMFEDGKALDVVQDGGMANVGLKVGFDSGLTLTAGWGGVLFSEEPMYESPTWKTFAGLTYHRPHKVLSSIGPPSGLEEVPPAKLKEPEPEVPLEWPKPPGYGDPICSGRTFLMIHFEFDKATLTPESIEVLRRIGKYLRLCDEQGPLEVQGHADWDGAENYNIGLANRRARAVVYYLVYDEGIDPKRIVAPEKLARGLLVGESYGESVPFASNDTEKGRALNRRVQFIKLAVR